MSLSINHDCINCDMCVPACPNNAISLGVTVYEIDANRCTECVGHYDQPQCQAVCPIDCIEQGPIEPAEALLARFTRLHG